MQFCEPSPILNWDSKNIDSAKVIIADTLCKRWQGLQWTKSLSPNTVMLFKPISQHIFFHTKNCLFPIDIIALNSLGLVLKIWTVRPNQIRIGPMPVGTNYAVEANAGWAAANNIKVGHSLYSLILITS